MIFNPILVGKQLPTLTTPGAASDLASGKQLIGQDGEIVTGNVPVVTGLSMTGTPSVSGSNLVIGRPSTMRAILPYQVPVKMDAPLSSLGDATAADVARGKTFTSTAGVKVTGTASFELNAALGMFSFSVDSTVYFMSPTEVQPGYSEYIAGMTNVPILVAEGTLVVVDTKGFRNTATVTGSVKQISGFGGGDAVGYVAFLATGAFTVNTY